MESFSRYVIAPMIRRNRWKTICEIGASLGNTADILLRLPLTGYTIVDPCFDANLPAKYAADGRVRVIKRNSLDALAEGGSFSSDSKFDCVLIDGDHNWYTVYNELRLIHERDLLTEGGCIFFHDVSWPYARRDMYYQPDTIPEQFRQPFAQKGMVRGQSPLAETGGLNPQLYNATHVGGPQNGVLTAIEDFLAEHPDKYCFCQIHAQYGLGILQFRVSRLNFAVQKLHAWFYTAAYLFVGAGKRALRHLCRIT